ncbi:MAG: ABC transporter substrate-binding protein, partial [Peptococcaceae bacterium]|nr:ABC transporter substrate-binding protein [Peptococcaceae bacterium]
RETTEIPILFTAVSDPIAVRLVKQLDQSQTNVTGTTDMNPIQEQFSLIKKLVPAAKCIGIIYNNQETFSQTQLNKALETAKAFNMNLVEAAVGSASEVPQAVNSLSGKVDVIYVPNDETLISVAPALAQAANQNKIPLFAGQKSFVNAGGLASICIDYERLGWQTGQMALKILQGSSPETMAVENPQEFEIIINKSTARLLDITIPDTLMPNLK